MKKLIVLSLLLSVIVLGFGCSTLFNKGEKSSKPTYSDTLDYVRVSSFAPYYIEWSSSAKNWPNVKDGNVVNVCGKIIVNGKFVERFRNTYSMQHLKNATEGRYHVPIKQGETVEIYFQSISDPSKRTNPVKFVWPWKSTY